MRPIFPIECMANDPTAKVIISKMNLPQDKLNEIGTSVLSIEMTEKKP